MPVFKRILCSTAVLLTLAVCPVHAEEAPLADIPPMPTPIRGMTVSSRAWGGEWGTPAMAATLDDLRSLGVNSIAIHPYAQIHEDGRVSFTSSSEDPAYLSTPLEWARERGMGVMFIPHIAYWGTKFSWRGAINFETAVEWDRFFDDYQVWIVRMARIAQKHGAGLFCVGLEFTYAQKFEARWREIIAAVRAVYRGKVTYGGNWDSYQEVKFYDALDYVGVLAYFPLTRTPNPSLEQIADGWRNHLANLKTLSARIGKPLLFVEIGYNESARAASDPWDFPKGGPNAAEIQLRCIEAALRLGASESALAGMFFWKWFPPAPVEAEETFDLRGSSIKKLIARYWAGQPAL
jgi:hypothetical protein